MDKQQPWSAVEGLTVALGLYGLSGVNQEHHAEVTGKILKWFAVNLSIARMQIDTTRPVRGTRPGLLWSTPPVRVHLSPIFQAANQAT